MHCTTAMKTLFVTTPMVASCVLVLEDGLEMVSHAQVKRSKKLLHPANYTYFQEQFCIEI